MRYKFKFCKDLTPQLGTRRVITRFLWLPKILKSELRWMEHAAINQWRGRCEWWDESWNQEGDEWLTYGYGSTIHL